MSLLPSSSPRLQIGYPQSQQQPTQPTRPTPKCAEVCLDLLTTEAVRFFSDKQYGPAAGAALQAVGFRVGRQLAERWVLLGFAVSTSKAVWSQASVLRYGCM